MGRFSLAYASLFTRDTEAVVSAAAAAGFEAVGIRISGRSPSDTNYPNLVNDAGAIRAIRRALAAGGLQLSNISTYHLSADISLADMQPVIDTAAELGGEMIVANCIDPDPARREAFIAGYCEAVVNAGLKLGIEFVPFSQVKTLDQALDLISAIDHPRFGMVLDSLHLGRSGGSPADIARVEPGRIFLAQLCDAPAKKPEDIDLPTEARTRRLYPGEGDLPLRDFLLALSADTPIDCELPCQSHADLPLEEQAQQVAGKCRRFIASVRNANSN